MKTMSAREAKNSFGLLLDSARAGPVIVEKHGRPVVVVLAIETYEALMRAAGGKKLDGKKIK
ncbi:type II toxin-antitoxin system Phd/YefM family antitoxin [Hyphococcus lacteus]|uniref:Antitoxin n=1 Tax=Hyphococcus lacteus TaxID=3143536 RepID=A0ABV3Z7M2_9PROT